MTNIQKCGVIGVGFVGATCAYTLAVSGLFSDLVLVDMNRDKAIGEAADINHGASCPPSSHSLRQSIVRRFCWLCPIRSMC